MSKPDTPRIKQDCGHEKCSVTVEIAEESIDGRPSVLRAGTHQMSTCHECQLEQVRRERDEARHERDIAREQASTRLIQAEATLARIDALVERWREHPTRKDGWLRGKCADELEAARRG